MSVIGLVPITPFSTLFLWPLTALAPLTAKHVWIALSLAILPLVAFLLHSMTGMSYRRIALILTSSVPLFRNLEFGQFYVLLLLLLVAACFFYLRGLPVLAAILVAVAAACKIFPLVFFAFFLQRREWRALFWAAITAVSIAVISIATFGWNANRTYWVEVLPWAVHGAGFQPYAVSASLSGILHHLFLSEPQWNPHPWHDSPLAYALLSPALEMLALAPAILLIDRDANTRRRILLEWSALLTASLAISTLPASYNFVLMVFPICVLAAELLEQKRYVWLAVLAGVYLGIGVPVLDAHRLAGPMILLSIPRLPLMFFLLLGIITLLWRDRRQPRTRWRNQSAWAIALSAFAAWNSISSLHRENALRQEYAYRLPLTSQGLLNAAPQPMGNGVAYIGLKFDGYHLIGEDPGALTPLYDSTSPQDTLSFARGFGQIWEEVSSSSGSAIVEAHEPSRVIVDNARDPMLSSDGRSMAFLRDDHGRSQLVVRRAFLSGKQSDISLTPASSNIFEASFRSESTYAFSAVEQGRPPQIYLNDRTHANAPLGLGVSRYPALSPDGLLMAYSRLEHGTWNLWLRNQKTGELHRVASLPCNQIEPAWESDSKTLLYATDCGRSLWFTAIARRRVIH